MEGAKPLCGTLLKVKGRATEDGRTEAASGMRTFQSFG